jgi:hypothetical protein
LALDEAAEAEREIEVQRCRREQRQPPPGPVLAKDAGEDDQPDTAENPHPVAIANINSSQLERVAAAAGGALIGLLAPPPKNNPATGG